VGKIRISVFVFLLFFIAACETPVDRIPGDQPLYFQYRYVNFAWGYQEHGWLIDHEGNLNYFSFPEDFQEADSTGHISGEDLVHNLGLTDSIISRIDASELAEYIQYIPGAATGKKGELRHIACDAGTSELSCYLYDPGADAYLEVFLAMSGDFEQFNLSDEARVLVEWLTGFDVFWLSD
jgi:hypothetical protein